MQALWKLFLFERKKKFFFPVDLYRQSTTPTRPVGHNAVPLMEIKNRMYLFSFSLVYREIIHAEGGR